MLFSLNTHFSKLCVILGTLMTPLSRQPELNFSRFCFQIKNKIRRILDSESFNVYVTPTAGKISLPTIIKLFPPTTKPLHKHPNMPMRFGRQSDAGGDRSMTATSHLPQRFGRSWQVVPKCAECPNAPLPPRTSTRNGLLWRLLRNLGNAQLLHRYFLT